MIPGVSTDNILSFLIALVLITGIFMVGSRRLASMIKLFAFQSLCLSILALVSGGFESHALMAVLLNVAGKSFVVPWFLFFVMNRVRPKRDVEAVLTLPSSMLVAGILIIISFMLTQNSGLQWGINHSRLLGTAVSLTMIGLFIMITRKKTFTQILGLYVMENGTFALTTATAIDMPMLVEMGIMLDLLLGVLIMGIWIFKIRKSFDTDSAEPLQELRG
jgi:hydrogenase-4 membrane subunit HyfE